MAARIVEEGFPVDGHSPLHPLDPKGMRRHGTLSQRPSRRSRENNAFVISKGAPTGGSPFYQDQLIYTP
jgi:hypothetical protein